jgi:hypothetical protein
MREKKLRLSAVVLLALVVHALFVTLTHHHQAQSHHRLSATPVIATDDHTPEEHLPQTRDDANCAACNLQRSFAAQIQTPTIQIEIGGQPLVRGVHLLHSYLNPTGFCSVGRSPPLV